MNDMSFVDSRIQESVLNLILAMNCQNITYESQRRAGQAVVVETGVNPNYINRITQY